MPPAVTGAVGKFLQLEHGTHSTKANSIRGPCERPDSRRPAWPDNALKCRLPSSLRLRSSGTSAANTEAGL